MSGRYISSVIWVGGISVQFLNRLQVIDQQYIKAAAEKKQDYLRALDDQVQYSIVYSVRFAICCMHDVDQHKESTEPSLPTLSTCVWDTQGLLAG